jgi:uncharacterized phage-associated protein
VQIRFTINTQKAITALLWIVQRGEANIYNAMKIIFAADKRHLNKYGRPVTGDKYVAMQFGTVPSWIYDATKLAKPGLGFVKNGNSLALEPGKGCDIALLSDSDIEALEHGFGEYAGKDFASVKQKNHGEKAWQKAIERNPGAEASEIFFEDMIEEEWLADELRELGQFIAV